MQRRCVVLRNTVAILIHVAERNFVGSFRLVVDALRVNYQATQCFFFSSKNEIFALMRYFVIRFPETTASRSLM